MARGFKRQMLAPAIADLDDKFFRLGEEAPWVELAVQLDFKFGQGGVKYGLLAAMQLLAGAAAKKARGSPERVFGS
ncbi:hypothetical protein N8D56_03550 [Devosia sp. A8/3-2]|nr:hypothetical protein N8D56_03550 [Devosia sp. A8/3-2]